MVYQCTLSPEIQKIARDELNENPETRQKDIEYIREWLQKQHHTTARTDDWTLLRFLRGCKFSLEKTKQKLDMFYTCRNLTPEWFLNRDPLEPKIAESLKAGVFLPIPGYDNNGRKVNMFQMSKHNPSTNTIDELLKGVQMIYDLVIEEDAQCSVTGITLVADLKGVTASHALQMTPTLIKKTLTIWEKAYPLRIKSIHYVNTPPFFQAILNLAISLMSEKLRKRVVIHGDDMKTLFEHIPQSILPKEYGGTNQSSQEISDYWVEKLNKNRKWLLEDEKYKVDESKRPGKPKTTSDLYGIEGSFRKLNVD